MCRISSLSCLTSRSGRPLDRSPSRGSPEILSADWGFWRTVSLNLSMVDRSPLLAALPVPLHDRIRERIRQLQERVGALEPKRRFAFLSAQWWQDVDSPAVSDAPVRLPGAPTRP